MYSALALYQPLSTGWASSSYVLLKACYPLPTNPASKQCLLFELFTKNADWCSLPPSSVLPVVLLFSSRTRPTLCPSVSSYQRVHTMRESCYELLGTWAAILISGSQGKGVLFRYACNLQKFIETLSGRQGWLWHSLPLAHQTFPSSRSVGRQLITWVHHPSSKKTLIGSANF